MVGDQLVIYTPLYLSEFDLDEGVVFPLYRRRHRDGTAEFWQPLFAATDLHWPIQRSVEPVIHTVSMCPITAEDGEEGIQVARDQAPDLILMDVVMPNLNGFQATRTLSRDEATAHIPIILVTTKDQETDRVWGLRQGAKDYIAKPADEQELISKVSAVLAG